MVYHSPGRPESQSAIDDILHGYRVAGGTANAPGRALGGWCSPNSNTVLGQWLQSMARMQRAYGDKDLLEKANVLVSEYARCWPGMSRGSATGGLSHYPYEKLVGGLVDMYHYGGNAEAPARRWPMTRLATPSICTF